MKHLLLTGFWFLVATDQYLLAQPKREDIYTDYVFYDKRVRLQKDLNENTIGKTFSGPLTSDNEHRFESACLAVSQFLLNNETISSGIRKMLEQYDSLGIDTRRALLEAVYASYPAAFAFDIQQIMQREKDPKLFAMCGVYLYRNHRTTEQANAIKLKMIESFPAYDTLDLLLALEEHLNDKHGPAHKPPPLKDLFEHQKKMNNKVIYSFQRWNRDYPGLAVVQNADGRFVRHPDGRLMVFEQLARSASGMPFFLTNGNTPQGIYSILGTGVSRNQFIGPTPNIQMVMPFEDPSRPFVHTHQREKEDMQMAYRQLLPDTWKAYAPMMESFKAGKIGRTAIIAHGSTLDPEYFRDRPFYPLTPTMGCLCAKELWNVTSGKLLISEQYNLYSAFTSTPGSKGYLIVVNLDDQQQPVSRAEIEKIIGK